MLNRRQLLIAVGRSSLLLPAALNLVACQREPDAPPAVQATGPANLGEYAGAMQAISYIGVACLPVLGIDPATPVEVTTAAIGDRLRADLSEPSGEAALAAVIDRTIRDDFDLGRVLEVEGWRLSETECRLAALAALTQGYHEPQLPEQPGEQVGFIAEIEDWGPKSTPQGQAFNQQPDGHSGLWFRARGVPASSVLRFDGKNQDTQVYADLFTSGLSGRFMEDVINTPGAYSVALFDKATQVLQPIGEFTVHSNPPEAVEALYADLDQCAVEKWGPVHVNAGQRFNPQPDGSSAFWVRTNCAYDGSRLVFDGEPLKTTTRDIGLTASMPNGHELEPGEYELKIALGHSGKFLAVGTFRVGPGP
jgi:hypothetical protein